MDYSENRKQTCFKQLSSKNGKCATAMRRSVHRSRATYSWVQHVEGYVGGTCTMNIKLSKRIMVHQDDSKEMGSN